MIPVPSNTRVWLAAGVTDMVGHLIPSIGAGDDLGPVEKPQVNAPPEDVFHYWFAHKWVNVLRSNADTFVLELATSPHPVPMTLWSHLVYLSESGARELRDRISALLDDRLSPTTEKDSDTSGSRRVTMNPNMFAPYEADDTEPFEDFILAASKAQGGAPQTIIYYGPRNTWAANMDNVRSYFGCTHLVEDWTSGGNLTEGALHITTKDLESPGQCAAWEDHVGTRAWVMSTAAGKKFHAAGWKPDPAQDSEQWEWTAQAPGSHGVEQRATAGENLIGTVWIHVETGHHYAVVGECMDERTWSPGVLYCRKDGTSKRPIMRVKSEFLDGRFVVDLYPRIDP